jgi:hypothetical protein
MQHLPLMLLLFNIAMNPILQRLGHPGLSINAFLTAWARWTLRHRLEVTKSRIFVLFEVTNADTNGLFVLVWAVFELDFSSSTQSY